MQKQSVRWIGILVAITLTSSILAYQTGLTSSAVSSSTVATLNQWAMLKDCNYTIFTDGTNYYAQNCDTGAIDYGGSNDAGGVDGASATAVFDAVVDASAGKVFVKRGTYTFNSGFSIAKGITLVGENQRGTIFNFSPAGTFITIDGTTGADTTIAHLQIVGNNGASAQTAIDITSGTTADVNIYDTDIHFFAGSGSYVLNANGAINVHVYENHWWNNSFGILLRGASTVARIHDNYFSWGAGAAAWIVSVNGTSTGTNVYDNVFEGSTKRVIVATNQANIHNNFFENNGSSETDLYVSGSNVLVNENYFTGTVTFVGSAPRVHNNQGFKTENEGTGTINSGSTSATISHGLGYTPTATEINIAFTEDPTNDPTFWWISGITSTQFTLNVNTDPGASNLDFSWGINRITS